MRPKNLGLDAMLGKPALGQIVPGWSSTSGPLLSRSALSLVEIARISFRIEYPEGKVLQLVADALHAHAGRRAAHRSPSSPRRSARASPPGMNWMRAHVVQPVGQLDQQDANVLGRRPARACEGSPPAGVSRVASSSRCSLVTPSTSLPIAGPKSWSISARVAPCLRSCRAAARWRSRHRRASGRSGSPRLRAGARSTGRRTRASARRASAWRRRRRG